VQSKEASASARGARQEVKHAPYGRAEIPSLSGFERPTYHRKIGLTEPIRRRTTWRVPPYQGHHHNRLAFLLMVVSISQLDKTPPYLRHSQWVRPST
jgi:hypothetical protein